jgi:formylglycine-generating enzyme required for sulfatase activity
VNDVDDPNLDSIAWYAANDAGRTHRVAQKRPNRWMLFDVLGNVYEWTFDHPVFRDPPGPLVDPEAQFQESDRRVAKGGRVTNWPDMLRAADWDYPPGAALEGYGFRLVRTLLR